MNTSGGRAECAINIPPFLTSLTLGECFNEFIPNLPPSLTFLKFGNRFKQPIHFRSDKGKITHLPPSLIDVILPDSFPPLPSSIQTIRIHPSSSIVDQLPTNLKELTIAYDTEIFQVSFHTFTWSAFKCKQVKY